MPELPIAAAIALGSNLGDRAAHLAAALAALAVLPRTTLTASSPFFETVPIGPIAQGAFLNAVAMLATSLPPRELLAHLHRIEASEGRDRASGERWGPRTLDLDLLVLGGRVMSEPGLTLPHPRLRERAFVLVPLASIAPALVIPASPEGSRTTVSEALGNLSRQGGIPPGSCTLHQHP